MNPEMLPWLSPDDSVEACELLEEVAKTLEHFAQYSPMRKELRMRLDDRARQCRIFLQRINQPVIDRSVVLAVDEFAERKKMKSRFAFGWIIENFISRINRSA